VSSLPTTSRRGTSAGAGPAVEHSVRPRTARRLPWKIALYWTVLAATWYVLSGRFDLLHFGTGVIAALVIAMQSRRLDDGTRFAAVRFLLFVPWLAVQVVASNVRVARCVLTRRLPIAPTLVRMPPGVTGDRALAMLGTSTTLTPGTLTVDVDPHELLVHALDRHSAEEVRGGEMARRIARVFPQEA
jgi:multicomponent Na+:H+ antiporter subunit E